jgi:hypothetical protein
MPLGVHLPDCPCARCQACAPIVQRINNGELVPNTKTADVARGASTPRWQRDPWADAEGSDD